MNIPKNKKVMNLTALELKELIREVISEEISKRCLTQPFLPAQPYYYIPAPAYPYQYQEVWADTEIRTNSSSKNNNNYTTYTTITETDI